MEPEASMINIISGYWALACAPVDVNKLKKMTTVDNKDINDRMVPPVVSLEIVML
jgi:hypothetical protein